MAKVLTKAEEKAKAAIKKYEAAQKDANKASKLYSSLQAKADKLRVKADAAEEKVLEEQKGDDVKVASSVFRSPRYGC